jgi:YggT family protein
MIGFVAQVLNLFFWVLYILLLIRILLSWVSAGRSSQLAELVFNLTEPFLAPLRRLVQASPLGGSMQFDFSPLIAFIILSFFQNIVGALLRF